MQSGIRADFDPSRRGVTVEYDAPEDIVFQIDEMMNGRITFASSIPMPGPAAVSATVSQHAYVEIRTDSEWTLKEVSEYMACFRHFIHLATDRAVSPTRLWIYPDDFADSAGGDHVRDLALDIVFETGWADGDPPKLNSPFFLFRFRDIRAVFESSIKSWCAAYMADRRPHSLYFGADQSDVETRADRRFLQIAEAMEALDRVAGGGRNAKLKNRIVRLAKPFSILLGDQARHEHIAGQVADTRNYLVHHDEELFSRAAKGSELIRLTQWCEVLCMLWMSNLFVCDADAVCELVGDSHPVRTRLQQR